MTTYYLGIGYGNTFTDGVFVDDPTLPIDGDNDIVENLRVHADDNPYNYDEVVSHYVSKLKENDGLIVLWRNQAALGILDEDIEEFHVPVNQREELWNSEGLVDTYTYFTDPDDEEWGFLVNE
jgi:hypothetical protein